ncbi:BTAD domain-containing putative transcriptional regulator [Streptomyces sp. MP131-18]|uniref:BTAD domain-containing putative transcriptional regulator n=1 Tax=Streptomyces sp. MP131-18 TaxID=1857892 RepID=UPI00097BB5FB|nr:BTAD domain-containing putative transcriptional regulator [Streptomyces sp. MP131-18]
MRFGVLGPLRVTAADGRAVRVPEAKVRAVLANLLMHEGRPVPAARLIDDVWDGERLPARPGAALQAKVSQLRRALEAAGPGGRDLVVSGPSGYALLVAGAEVDAIRFAELLAQARSYGTDPRRRAALLDEALELWRGPAFADFADAPFARPAIMRLEEERLAAQEERAHARLALGEHDALLPELTGLVARHPLRERLRALQLKALYRTGRQGEALESFEELRRRLRDELGADPGPEVVAVHQAVLRQDPLLDAPPAAPPGRRALAVLPAPLNGLIGRESAVDEVAALLSAHRMVTLTGPGGVGKTRLALAVADRLTDRFPQGTALVELAAAPARPEAVTDAVAAALGTRHGDRLAAELGPGERLLVLDGCEPVIEQAAELAERLLRAAPGLRVLATSQLPAGISGEALWAVPPLDVPPPDAAPRAVQEAGAVRLFAARAAAAAPGFALGADNAAAVAAVCRRLDGVPLALELAATRVRALGVQRLADLLDDRFRVLTQGARNAPARQRTLRAVLDWSWEPLDEPERAVLRRLAVHPGGASLNAVEAVCSDGGPESFGKGPGGVVSEEPGDVLEPLARLVDRSLVTMTETEHGPRYRLLESVAAYGVERLREAGEHAEMVRRRDAYYTMLAECAEAYQRIGSEGEWLAVLDTETGNLRAALDGALLRRDAALALRLVTALAWYWVRRGRCGEADRSLADALGIVGESTTHDDDGPSAAGPCGEALPSGTRERAVAWRSGLGLLDRTAPYEGRPFAELGLGLVARRTGRLEPAERHLNAALDWCGQDGFLTVEALVLTELGFAAELRGAPEEALARHGKALAAARAAGDARAVGYALEGLAGAHALAGDGGTAARLLEEATAARAGAGAPPSPAERGDVDRVTAAVSAALDPAR